MLIAIRSSKSSLIMGENFMSPRKVEGPASSGRSMVLRAMGLALLTTVLGLPSFGQGISGKGTPPDFSPRPDVSWTTVISEYLAPESGPGPVMDDPAHPYIDNRVAERTGQQPTFPVGDASNPILQPWARESVLRHNARVLSGKPTYTLQARCWPMGTPGFLLHPAQAVYIIQSPKEVVLTWEGDMISRHIYLNVAHQTNAKPSWFGDSVGHYEGDTLVVDTVGMNDRTFIDNFDTPHTTKLHVEERFHMIDNGKTLEVRIHVEDPGAFTSPWNAIQRYHRTEGAAMTERSCAEGTSLDYFDLEKKEDQKPIPMASKPDF
jgi:hypothetical protein